MKNIRTFAFVAPFVAPLVCSCLAILSISCGDSSNAESPAGLSDEAGTDDATSESGRNTADAGPDGRIDGSTPATGLSPAMLASLANDLASAKCDQARTCGGFQIVSEGPHDSHPLLWGPVKMGDTDCRDATAASFRNKFLAKFEEALEQGAAAYHADLMPACLEAIRKACDSDTLLPPACRDALEGTTAIGGSCEADVACANHGLCEFNDDNHCRGTCIVPHGPAEPCYFGSGCAEGLYCPPNGGLCTLRPAKGETCVELNGNVPCAGFLYCTQPSQLQSPTCKSFAEIGTGTVGSPCEFSNGPWCQAPLGCADESAPPDAGVNSGSSCRGTYASGSTCYVGYPDPCPDAEYCEAGMVFTGVCTPRRPVGATCSVKQICQAGLSCLGVTVNTGGICVQMVDNGQPCRANAYCFSGFCSKGGKCQSANQSCK